MTNTNTKKSETDRYGQDCTEIIEQPNQTFFASHSLCINCTDYYDVPPCLKNLSADSGCFPSVTSIDRN